MKTREVLIDSGAWIALAEVKDPLHERAKSTWSDLLRNGTPLCSTVPIVIETLTFLDRRGSRELALTWREGLKKVPKFRILPCSPADLEDSFGYLLRKEFHKLSIVDATSFLLMKKYQLAAAFTFDTHFAIAGFRLAE